MITTKFPPTHVITPFPSQSISSSSPPSIKMSPHHMIYSPASHSSTLSSTATSPVLSLSSSSSSSSSSSHPIISSASSSVFSSLASYDHRIDVKQHPHHDHFFFSQFRSRAPYISHHNASSITSNIKNHTITSHTLQPYIIPSFDFELDNYGDENESDLDEFDYHPQPNGNSFHSSRYVESIDNSLLIQYDFSLHELAHEHDTVAFVSSNQLNLFDINSNRYDNMDHEVVSDDMPDSISAESPPEVVDTTSGNLTLHLVDSITCSTISSPSPSNRSSSSVSSSSCALAASAESSPLSICPSSDASSVSSTSTVLLIPLESLKSVHGSPLNSASVCSASVCSSPMLKSRNSHVDRVKTCALRLLSYISDENT